MSSHVYIGTSITDTIFGSSGNDRMRGEGNFYGLNGEDKFRFSGTAHGGPGNDIIISNSRSGDVGYGDAGNDTLEGYYHSSAIFYGGGGNDTFRYVRGSELFGGGDEDLFLINDHDNTITGGAGADVFRFVSAPTDYDGEVTNLRGNIITDFQVSKDKIDLGTLDFSANNRLTWDEISIVAEGSDTRITGLGSTSGQQIDLLLKDVDASRLDENNFIVASKATLTGTDGQDNLLGSRAIDIIRGGGGRDRLVGLEGDDRLRGGLGRDSISGDAGDDRLFGGAGSDELDGGEGNDILRGGRGKDDLSGGSGDDILNGGANFDTFTGGRGADIFVFDNNQADWRERVMDFEVGTDLIRIAGGVEFDDLGFWVMTLAQGDGVIVNYGNGSVFLVGQELSEIDNADNFEFV